MKHVVCNGYLVKKLKIYLALTLVLMTIISDVKITKASNNRDYLNITLADIIITWYNASGVAISNSHLLGEIESLYGLITIEDLVDNDIIVTGDITATKEDIKDAIGYGSSSVPYLKIDSTKLRTYLNGLPTDEVANKALKAMFSWENNATEEAIFEGLGIAVGNVVNLGKIGYNVVKDVLVNAVHSLPLVNTLKDVYNNFTNSTYFQDLLHTSSEVDTLFDYSPFTIMTTVEIPEGYQLFCNVSKNSYYGEPSYLFPKHGFVVVRKSTGQYPEFYGVNNTSETITYYTVSTTVNRTENKITITRIDDTNTLVPNELVLIRTVLASTTISNMTFYGPYINDFNKLHDLEWYKENDPWGNETSQGTSGISDYINAKVGNITIANYMNLTPNISKDEYMYVFNKYQYDVIINQITNNTTNGDYIDNGPIITNYNTTYIQNPIAVETRPTYIPAPTGQPVQPFISPRPTPIPEETEEAIYNGGIAESIKDKFPFCIPWDIQSLITGLWSNNRQAPYIHWDANFGSLGKLGEVNIDLQPFDTAAQIFRSTTLLLWIIGLVVITRNIIGS